MDRKQAAEVALKLSMLIEANHNMIKDLDKEIEECETTLNNLNASEADKFGASETLKTIRRLKEKHSENIKECMKYGKAVLKILNDEN
jgi:uncharacterized coiled-coil DUF342 family protein